MPTSTVVASKLVDLAARSGQDLSPMQIVRLAYICQGWMMALYDRPLFTDPIFTGKFGPEIPDLLNAFKIARDGRIIFAPPASTASPLEALEEDVVAQVLENYGQFDDAALHELTAKPGTPWHHAISRHSAALQIPLDWLRTYYANVSRQSFVAA